MRAGMKTKDDDPCLAHGIPLRQSDNMWKKRGTVTAGLASGRPLHNDAKAKLPPISPKGVLFGRRPDRGRGVPASGPSRAARHVVADRWRQADHYVTRPRRSSRLFPKRVFYSAGDPTRGRLDLNLRSGTQTIASSPDLCKSGAESVKI